MLCFKADNVDNFFNRFADLKGGVDAAEVVRAQLLQVKEVLDHNGQKALTCIVYVQRVGQFAVNALQPLFETIRTEVHCADHLYKVIDLAHRHIHDEILRVDRIQRIACVVRGCSVNRGHENFFFLFFAHMDCGGLVVYLQDEAIFTLALDLLVHDLDVFKAAALRNFAIDDWDGEFVFERLQVKLFRF